MIVEVNIYGRNIKVTERLEEYVSEKVQKFAQLGDNVKDIDVKFSKDGHLGGESIRVEITVVGTGPVLRSEAQGHDKFAVFDETYGKLLERLRRARDRRKLHKRGGKHPVSVADATGSIPVVTEAITEILLPDVPVEEAAFDNSEVTLADEAASPIEIRHKSFKGERLTVWNWSATTSTCTLTARPAHRLRHTAVRAGATASLLWTTSKTNVPAGC